MLRWLLRSVLRLTVLAGAGYAVYRLMRTASLRPGPAAIPSPPPPAERTEPREVTRRPGAGTKPGGSDRPAARPEQPTREGVSPGSASARSIAVGEVPAHVQRWVEPDAGGSCPGSHPVKAKVESGIFHVPGGAHYDRTHADRCYRDPDAASEDGLRPSKQ